MFKVKLLENLLNEFYLNFISVGDRTQPRTFLGFTLPWRNHHDADFYLGLVLLLGVPNMMYRMYQFILVYSSKEINPPNRWGNNRFYAMPPPWARKFNIVKRFTQVNAWAFLLYAAILNSRGHLYPWLLVAGFGICVNVVTVSLNFIVRLADGQRVWQVFQLILSALIGWIIYMGMWGLFAARNEDTININKYFSAKEKAL